MEIPGYTIIEKINIGGMASVYLATQLSVGRRVALKIMKQELDQDPEFHKRFQREAVIVGQLSHPNIIPIYDVGRHNGLNYISMEYLPNGSLEEKIISGISANEAVDIIISIAGALEHAHTKGYVHRDIKPENILFRADNSAVLTDFGIAKTIASDLSVTQSGSVVGTPYYMSPEQAKGEPSDGRSDLYSVGILFYEILTGSRPFNSDSSLSLALQHVSERPPRLPIQYLAFQEVIDRLLAKEPQQRFQSARELILALENIKVSLNPLLQEENNKAGSLALFKAICRIAIHDCHIIAKKCVKAISKILSRNNNDKTQLITFDPLLSSDSISAKTTISNTAVESAVTPPSPKKYLWAYGATALAITALIIAYNSGNHKKGSTNNLPKDLFYERNSGAASSVSLFTLKVNPTPDSAAVRILNIQEKYAYGIQLPSGNYQIEVSEPEYQTKIEWVKIDNKSQSINIELNKISDIDSSDKIFTLPEMTEVIAGSFLMGDPSSDAKEPQKKVAVESNYFIGKYEITFNEYDYFAIATNRHLPDDNGWGRGKRPVINVSWEDANAYTDWLSKTTEQRYRLPTDIEWEFAARANTNSLYWWGDNKDDAIKHANCRFGCRSFFANIIGNKTQPVGTFSFNNFGLYDTAGNVAEWVEDCDDREGKKEDTSKEECESRIIRGGSFRDSVKNIASHSKNYLSATDSNSTTGFRIVRELSSEKRIERKSEKAPRKNLFQRIIQKFK